MAIAIDDLEYNSFYQALNSQYSVKHEEAVRNCWLVCVPKSRSLKGVKIDDNFVDCHLLKPSPLYKSHYNSSDRGSKKLIELDGKFLRTISGFSSNRSVEVLSEEPAYNKNMKPYKILIIDEPLDPDYVMSDTSIDKVENKLATLGFLESMTYLQNFAEHADVLPKIHKRIKHFNDSYMFLPGYLEQAAPQVEELISWTIKMLLDSHPEKLEETNPLYVDITAAAESVVLGYVHRNLYSCIKKACKSQDELLSKHLKELHSFNVTPQQLGVQEAFCCSLQMAISELFQLESKNTPAAKLWCLKTTLDLLFSEVEKHFKEISGIFPCEKDSAVLCSDDLIPLLAIVLIQSRPPHISSTLYYIKKFTWHHFPKDVLSYTVVSFEAALEFIKMHDFAEIKNQKTKNRPQPVELPTEKRASPSPPSSSKVQSPKATKYSQTTPLDIQLQKITRMIESTDMKLWTELDDSANSKRKPMVPQKAKSKDSENLGEFLTSLQQNTLAVSFGKQS